MENHSRMLVSPRRVPSTNNTPNTSFSAQQQQQQQLQHHASSSISPHYVIYPTQFLSAATSSGENSSEQQQQQHLNVSSAPAANDTTAASTASAGGNTSLPSILFAGMNAGEAANFSVYHQTLAQMYNERFKSTVQNFWHTMSEEMPLDHILLQLMVDSNTAPYVKCRVSEVVEASLMSHLNLQCHSLMGELTKREIELSQLRSSLQQQQWNETAADAHNTSTSSQPQQQRTRCRSPAEDVNMNSNEVASSSSKSTNNFSCTMQEYEDLMKRFSTEIDTARRASSENAHRAMVAEDRLHEFEHEVTKLQKQAASVQKEYDALGQQLQLETKDRSVKAKALSHQVQRLLRSVDKHAEKPFELVNDLCVDALAVCALSLEYAGEDPLVANIDGGASASGALASPRELKSTHAVAPSRAASLQAVLESKRHLIDGALDEVREATKFLQTSAAEQERLLKSLSESEKEVLTLRDRIETLDGDLAAARHGNIVGQELHALSSQFTKQRDELDQRPNLDQVRELTNASEERILQAINKHLQSFMHSVNEQQATITEGLRSKIDSLTTLSESMIAKTERSKSEIHESVHSGHQQHQQTMVAESLSQLQSLLLSIRTDLSKHDNETQQSGVVTQLSGQLAEAVTAISSVIKETAEQSSSALREGLQDTKNAETCKVEQLLSAYRSENRHLTHEEQQNLFMRFEEQLTAVVQQHDRSATAAEEQSEERRQFVQQQQQQHEVLAALLTSAQERTVEAMKGELSSLTETYNGQQSKQVNAVIDRCDRVLGQHLEPLMTAVNEQQQQLSQQLRSIVPSVSSAVSSLVHETTTTIINQHHEAAARASNATKEEQQQYLVIQQQQQQERDAMIQLAQKQQEFAELEQRSSTLEQQHEKLRSQLEQQHALLAQEKQDHMQEERVHQQEVSQYKDELSAAQQQIAKLVWQVNSMTQQLVKAIQLSSSTALPDVKSATVDATEEMLKATADKITEEVRSLRMQNDKMRSLLESYKRDVLSLAKAMKHETSSLKRELSSVKSTTQGNLQQLQMNVCSDVANMANGAFVSRHQLLTAVVARMLSIVQSATSNSANNENSDAIVSRLELEKLFDASLTDAQLTRALNAIESSVQQHVAAFRHAASEKHSADLREVLIKLHQQSHEESLQLLLETTENTAAAAKAVTTAMDKQAKMNEDTRRMIEDKYQSDTQHGEQLLERQQRLLLEQRERELAADFQRRNAEEESRSRAIVDENALATVTELGHEAVTRLESENRDLKSQVSLQKMSFEQALAMKDVELENTKARLASINTKLLDQERRNGQLHERCSAKEKEIVRLSTLLKQQQLQEQEQHNTSSSYMLHNPHNRSTSSARGGSTPGFLSSTIYPSRPNAGNRGALDNQNDGSEEKHNNYNNGSDASPNPNPFMTLMGSAPSSSRSPTRDPSSSSQQRYNETLMQSKIQQQQEQQRGSGGAMEMSRDSMRHFQSHDQSNTSVS